MQLCPGAALNVMHVQSNCESIVVGSSDGCVRLYDYQFRVQAWFEDINAGSIKVRFNIFSTVRLSYFCSVRFI